jgi:hypothetical protein
MVLDFSEKTKKINLKISFSPPRTQGRGEKFLFGGEMAFLVNPIRRGGFAVDVLRVS